MAIYQGGDMEKPAALAFAQDLGLTRLDSPPAPGGNGVTEIRARGSA